MVTQAELARRLKEARVQAGLTQEQVATALDIPRTAVVQMEAGKRAVTSLELYRFARLLGREVQEFLAEEEPVGDPVAALFRVEQGIDSSRIAPELRRCANLARDATRLEGLLALDESRVPPVAYDMPPLKNRWNAVQQGRILAEHERNRLGLGSSPVWELPGVIRRQGVRVSELELADEISGVFFHSPEIGLVIIVNRIHVRTRRLFSYAHEYCHLLADRDRPGTISHAENRSDLPEVRANAFAAHLLMPESGVREFLQGLGKEDAGRQTQMIFGVEGEVAVRRRGDEASAELQLHDVANLAKHFGTSYDAALYQLLNLRFLSQERFDQLKGQADKASRLVRAAGVGDWDEELHWALSEQVLSLAFEAYHQEKISRRKVLELAEEAGVVVAELGAVLNADEDGGTSEALVPG